MRPAAVLVRGRTAEDLAVFVTRPRTTGSTTVAGHVPGLLPTGLPALESARTLLLGLGLGRRQGGRAAGRQESVRPR
ncbi:hypothetical protein CUT44_04945 [Streptomyces carminius]|uniref:Uncharacterized protein n=1 Tax=Streptomyces carminius TaxID=2665496 RepID=A0A2M8M5A5_9ACTN|nr:hypothetical protein CUT44_04945 [Streptomyces carminius]